MEPLPRKHTQDPTDDVEGLSIDAVRARIYCPVDVEHVASILDGGLRTEVFGGEVVTASGRFRNLWVGAGPGHLIITGSPGRFLYGVNLLRAGWEQMPDFVSALSRTLGAPEGAVREAKTSRLDVAMDVLVDHRPTAYFDVFGRAPNLRRDPWYVGSLYYRQGRRGRLIRIYDKLLEMEKKGTLRLAPRWARDRHVLRIEVQVSSAHKTFGEAVTLGTLADPAFWPRVIDHWEKNVGSIERAPAGFPPTPDGGVPRTPTQLKGLLAAMGTEASGGADAVVSKIEDHAAEGLVTGPQRSALIKTAYSLRLTPRQRAFASELSRELDAKVEDLLGRERARASAGP